MSQPEFQQIVAQAPRKFLVVLSQTNAAPVTVGGNESVYFYPPSGYIARTVNIRILIPKMGTAASGSHDVYLQYSNGGGDLMHANATYTSDLSYNYSGFDSATVIAPAAAEPQALIAKTTEFDSAQGILFKYYNNLNVSQTNARTYTIVIVQELVAS